MGHTQELVRNGESWAQPTYWIRIYIALRSPGVLYWSWRRTALGQQGWNRLRGKTEGEKGGRKEMVWAKE